MNLQTQTIIQFPIENKPVQGCTISRLIFNNNENELSIFSLSNNTDISDETYQYHKLIHVIFGEMDITSPTSTTIHLNTDTCIYTPINQPFGIKATTDCIYQELILRKDTMMNKTIQTNTCFNIKDLIPYKNDSIINMDLATNESMKYVLMSFDQGTGLSEHAAPAEALVTILEGEAILTYEGQEYKLKAGESFKFEKNGKHALNAEKPFKMSLLLVKE